MISAEMADPRMPSALFQFAIAVPIVAALSV